MTGGSGELSEDVTQILPPEHVQDSPHAIPLNTVNVETSEDDKFAGGRGEGGNIVVRSEVRVTRAGEEAEETGPPQLGKAF